MASNKSAIENYDRELKHLGFLRVIAINAWVCVSRLYESAKLNSGPLKSTVGTVESAATSIVGPVYGKFKDLPDNFLVFLDSKVDEATNKFEEHAPQLAKKLVSQAQSVVHKASQIAENLVQEAKAGGPIAAIHYAGALYKQSVPIQLAKTWYGLNKIPLVHSVAQLALPVAVNLSEKYNTVIAGLAAKGYPLFSHVPLVPIDEIATAYNKQVEPSDGANSAETETETD